MTDLDAIRARDAAVGPHVPYSEADMWEALADRRTLLAEVDRLSRKPDVLRELDLLGRATRAEAELAAERARIAEAIRALPGDAMWDHSHHAHPDAVDRAAVLAIVEGEA